VVILLFSFIITGIVRRRPTDYEVKKFAVDYMEELGAFKYTLQSLAKYDQEAREEIDNLGGNEHLIKLLDYLKIF
jgi:geranylgeranyl diphosphate synthase, putative